MKFFFNTAPHNSGIALLMTLWVLVMLSVIAMSFSFSTRWGSASTRNFKEETKAYYLAMSGYQEAVGYLLSAKSNIVFIDAEGNFYIDKGSDKGKEPFEGKRATDEGEVEIKVSDEESKLNINVADDARLKMIFDYAGMPADEQPGVIDCIMDWKDIDIIGGSDLHRLNGAESDYYENLDPPYKAKNGNFDVIEELLLVKGFKPEYLYGSKDSKDIRPMYDLITTSGDGSININTVSKEVMEMIGMNQIDIDAAFKQRTKEFGGYTSTPNFVTKGFILKTVSNNFRIEITAGMKGNNQALKITSIVKRIPTDKGFDLQTVYWREKIENRRG